MSDEPTAGAGPPLENRPFQFHLIHLLMLPVPVALFLGIGLWLGWGVAVVLAMLAWVVVAAVKGRFPLLTVVLVLGLLGVLVALLTPSINGGPPSRRSLCMNNLKQIGLALLNYESAYGCFPPAVTTDAQGRPMHSWRVQILPFMEEKALHDQYRFDEPWDGPNNRKLHDIAIPVFRCPSERAGAETDTSYFAVIGPGTAWGKDRSTTFGDITDGASRTIMVVEVANSGIHWMEPRDLHVLQMAPGINPKSGQGISSAHVAGANILFADGAVHFLAEDLPPEKIKAMLTIAGGEEVDPDDW
jgi:prepilin-type processing-associated H-X9-DG protein